MVALNAAENIGLKDYSKANFHLIRYDDLVKNILQCTYSLINKSAYTIKQAIYTAKHNNCFAFFIFMFYA